MLQPITRITPAMRPMLLRRFSPSAMWCTLRAAVVLEWQVQGNWTSPWLFLLFLIVKPLIAALVLVFMYWVVSGFHSHGSILGFLIVGSASWSFMEQVISGLPRAVLDDREQFAMLKYVYLAPQSFIVFLIGRSTLRLLAAFISFGATLGFGMLVLGVPINLLQVNYPLLLVAVMLGCVNVVALGLAIAGLVLVLKRGAWQLPDAMVGALYLIAGTIFPISILPQWIEWIALILPLAYWLELMRRALLGNAIGAVFPIANTSEIIGLLIVTTLAMCAVCYVVFRMSEHIARERGQIDRATGD